MSSFATSDQAHRGVEEKSPPQFLHGRLWAVVLIGLGLFATVVWNATLIWLAALLIGKLAT